jgi:sulfoxide reductase heme-binding subunit YedZ
VKEENVARTIRSGKGRVWYLALIGLGALLLVVTLIAFRPNPNPLNWFIRGAALLGYLAVFLAILASAYTRQMVKLFGRSFVQVHHILAVAGLTLVTLHPLAVAWDTASPRVFVPTLTSWRALFTNGGRPAWYLVGIASLAGLLRTRIGRNWRLIHYLNYLVFWLATIHALLSGEDFQLTVLRGIPIVAAAIVLAVFLHKRVQAYQRSVARRRRTQT